MARLTTISLQTIGCKLNQAETESIARKFVNAGYQVVASDYAADIYVLNTCTVTQITDRKCRNLLRSAYRRNPNALIVATGCYAERAPSELNAVEELNIVVSNKDKSQIVDIIDARIKPHASRTSQQANIQKNRFHRTRAFVKIQEGCTHGCSFCIVPYVRGKEQSRPVGEIIDEINTRVTENYKEVILTGTRIGQYYDDNKELFDLIKLISKECNLLRLRISSLEPYDITNQLLTLWNDKRLCPHLHIPLQSGSDSVLERMGRGYSVAEYKETITQVRTAIPDMAITTDVMTGFPGESTKDFEVSFDFCKNMAFAKMHVFPYSARPGTKACTMKEHIGNEEKKRRTVLMLDLARESNQCFQKKFLGYNVDVLWETSKNGVWEGLTDNYMRIYLPSKGSFSNDLLTTRLVSLKDDHLYGELVTTKASPMHEKEAQ